MNALVESKSNIQQRTANMGFGDKAGRNTLYGNKHFNNKTKCLS